VTLIGESAPKSVTFHSFRATTKKLNTMTARLSQAEISGTGRAKERLPKEIQ